MEKNEAYSHGFQGADKILRCWIVCERYRVQLPCNGVQWDRDEKEQESHNHAGGFVGKSWWKSTHGIREEDGPKDPSQDTTAREQLGKHSESFKALGIDGSVRH